MQQAHTAGQRESSDTSHGDLAAGRGEAKHLRLAIEIAPVHPGLGSRRTFDRINLAALHRGEVDHQTAIVDGIAGHVVTATPDCHQLLHGRSRVESSSALDVDDAMALIRQAMKKVETLNRTQYEGITTDIRSAISPGPAHVGTRVATNADVSDWSRCWSLHAHARCFFNTLFSSATLCRRQRCHAPRLRKTMDG